MALRVERRDGSAERAVVTGCVVSRAVLGPIAARFERGLFPSPWAETVVRWCVAHYTEYREAPGPQIEKYFEQWAEGGRDRDTVKLVEAFLAGLSEEHQRLRKSCSPDYVLDLAARLFDRTRITDITDRVSAALEMGEVEKARELMQTFRPVQVGAATWVNPLTDRAAIVNAFEARQADLITYPGALGNFFAGAMGRDQFVAFEGKEKVGKSFFLLDAVVRASEQERNVAYFVTGDMSQAQVIQRLGARVACRPWRSGQTVRYPTAVFPGGPPNVERDVSTPPALSGTEAADILEAFDGRCGGDRIRLSVHPSNTLEVAQIEATLDGWERDGWRPDVVCVDYADILKLPSEFRENKLDGINDVWVNLAKMRLERHVLMLTGSQIKAAGFDAKILRREHFSGNHLKLAHVTGMVGINQTDNEKEDELYRLNWVVSRDLTFSEERCVWLASCLPVANPAVLSTF